MPVKHAMPYAMLYWGIYADILAIQKEGGRPREIRLGAEEYHNIMSVAATYGKDAISSPVADMTRMYGLPIKRLPIPHAWSVI